MRPVPSAIFLAVSIRGAIFWIVNVVIIFVGCKLGRKISASKPGHKIVATVRTDFGSNDGFSQQQFASNNVLMGYKKDVSKLLFKN